MTFDVPSLGDNEIHVWRMHAATAPFEDVLRAYGGPDMPAVIRSIHGKPHLPSPWHGLGFSWSHSRDLALFAVGRGAPGFELGVDVERVRPRPRALELARRFFAPDEANVLDAAQEEARLSLFLDLWTRKEAVLKAHGGGLSYGLHRVAFRHARDEWQPESFDGDVGPASTWHVTRVMDDQPDVFAALAWRDAERTVRVFTFPP